MMGSFERVLYRLTDLVSSHGVSRLEKGMGWSVDRYHKTRSRKWGFRLREVAEILDHLGESLTMGPKEDFAGAAERFMARGAALAKQHRKLLPYLGKAVAPNRISQEELESLDNLRLYDPLMAVQAAGERASEAAREGRARDAALLLARKAAALRLRLDPRGAHVCLWWGLGQLPEEPDLWLRASYVVADYGDYWGAADLAVVAMAGFAEQGDLGGIGRCVFNRARYFQYLEEKERACQGYHAALRILPKELTRSRCAAYQGLGILHLEADKVAEAADFAARAAEVENPPGIHGGFLYWFQARLARKMGLIENSITLYQRTIERLSPSPNKAALASCELVYFFLEIGRTEEAVQGARETMKYLEPRGNAIVAQALKPLRHLAGAAIEGSHLLTPALVERTIAGIQEGVRRSVRLQPHASIS